eukprot:jgi/Mesen1/9717/ME000693S09268
MATECLVKILRALTAWANKQLQAPAADLLSPRDSSASDAFSDGAESASSFTSCHPGSGGGGGSISGGGGGGGSGGGSDGGGTQEGSERGYEAMSDITSELGTKEMSHRGGGGGGEGDERSSVSESSDAAMFEARRAYKRELQDGIALFNRNPTGGLAYLVDSKKVGELPEDVAAFLKTASGLNKTQIGSYIGEHDEAATAVMHAFVDSFDFQNMEFDEAIRHFLRAFRLPGEAQKIDRIMEKFAERFCVCNPDAFGSAVTAHVLAYSVIMLNTDAHNPGVRTKMTKSEYLRNNRGIGQGKDLPPDMLGTIYDRIVGREIRMCAHAAASATPWKPALQRGGSTNERNACKARELKRLQDNADKLHAFQTSVEERAKNRSILWDPYHT